MTKKTTMSEREAGLKKEELEYENPLKKNVGTREEIILNNEKKEIVIEVGRAKLKNEVLRAGDLIELEKLHDEPIYDIVVDGKKVGHGHLVVIEAEAPGKWRYGIRITNLSQ